MQTPPLSLQETVQNGTIILTPQGQWCVRYLEKDYKSLQKFSPKSMHLNQRVIVNLSSLSSMDTAGAVLLLALKAQLEEKKLSVVFENGSNDIQQLLALVQRYPLALLKAKKGLSPFLLFILKIGQATVTLYFFSLQLVSFFGEVIVIFFRSLLGKVPFRFTALCANIQDVGVNAIPIITLISFLIGVVLSYQGVTQLRRFGAEIFTVNLLALGILREVGILITAVVVAGRSGSAFTAQIGTMALNEEIDAMRTMGLNPINVLVIPRLLALVISLPLLTFLSDVIGVLGGAFMTHILMDINFIQFIDQFKSAITPSTFWVGMAKAPVFAFLIALVGCFEGLQVKGSAESVGRQTTKSVVESIFLVIIADAAFSVLFSYLGI